MSQLQQQNQQQQPKQFEKEEKKNSNTKIRPNKCNGTLLSPRSLAENELYGKFMFISITICLANE